ncbi:MAG: type II secretion system F family protein [Bryobacteraceae bacterium]|nr:type II secretion system F family protein [Bryobacteraceae bacterium]
MIDFIMIAVIAWAVCLGSWLLISKGLRSKEADKLKSRLMGGPKAAEKAKKATRGPALLEQEDLTTGKLVRQVLAKFDLEERIATLLEQAGVRWKVARFMHLCLGFFLGGYALGWLFLPGTHRQFAIFVAFFVGALPLMHVSRKRAKRLHKFEELFPDSLEFVARSMRAGHAFSVSLEMIHREFQEPLAGEFRRTFEEHNLGLPLETALQKLGKRIPSLDVHFFVSAVLLQKRTGGNLAEILDKLAYVIRERFKLRGKIRAISAHGKMTGTALSLIPAGVAALNTVINPEYGKFFIVDEAGQMMLLAAVLLQLIGYGIIRKIVAIEV